MVDGSHDPSAFFYAGPKSYEEAVMWRLILVLVLLLLIFAVRAY
jgi:hypothetical protein